MIRCPPPEGTRAPDNHGHTPHLGGPMEVLVLPETRVSDIHVRPTGTEHPGVYSQFISTSLQNVYSLRRCLTFTLQNLNEKILQ